MRLIYLTNRDSEDHSSKYEADHCPRGATPILKKDIGEVCHRLRVESSQKQAFFLLAGCSAGLHNSFHPTIRDGSTRSKFGARGEHGDVFLFSNLGALRFSENRAPVLGELGLREVKKTFFP